MKPPLFFPISSLGCIGKGGSWQPKVDSPLVMVSIPASCLESENKGAVGFSLLPSTPYGTFPVPCGPNREPGIPVNFGASKRSVTPLH